jgi:hypothetical protein
MRESSDLRLPPPPKPSHSEFWPISIPPYRDDISPPWQQDLQGWKVLESHTIAAKMPADLLRKAEHMALQNGVVKQLLLNKRYISIGGSLRDITGERKGTESLVLFMFYNYTDDLTVEVWLDRTSQQVLRVTQRRYQPPAVHEEMERAIRLARHDSRLAHHLSHELKGTAIQVSWVDCFDRSATIPHYYHRLFEVRFSPPDERAPLYIALVDLSVEAVLQVASLDSSAPLE